MFAWLRQRRWQFSLRFLMGLMMVVAIGAALYGSHLRALQRQEVAFEVLAARGFDIIVYADGTYLSNAKSTGRYCGMGVERFIKASAAEPFTDDDIGMLEDVRKLRVVTMSGTNLSPEAVVRFKLAHPQCRVD